MSIWSTDFSKAQASAKKLKSFIRNFRKVLILPILFISFNNKVSPHTEWPSSKNIQIINVGKGVEKKEPSCIVCGNVN